MNICFILPCNYISNKHTVIVLAKSLQTVKDAPSISGLLWKGKMWATHPSSLRTCIIDLSTFPSPLEKLCLFVAISLSVKSLLVPFLARGVLKHKAFAGRILLKTYFLLHLILEL